MFFAFFTLNVFLRNGGQRYAFTALKQNAIGMYFCLLLYTLSCMDMLGDCQKTDGRVLGSCIMKMAV